MSTRIVTFVQEEFYHVYNRGTDKRVIFQCNEDYQRFIHLLYLCNSNNAVNFRSITRSSISVFEFDRGTQLVSIGAYCLMPNHFHILATPNTEGGLSIFMNKLCTSYSMYFNKRYERSSSLFEGPFKAEHIDSDEYLKYLFSYIHLNPVKLIQSDWKEVGIKDSLKALTYLENYKYSSFFDFDYDILSGVKKRYETNILSRAVFPQYFKDSSDFRTEIIEWLNFGDIHQGEP